MGEKFKNLISRLWANIKADLQRNLVAIRFFIWANWVITKFGGWLEEKSGDLTGWASDNIIGWEITKKALSIENEKKRKEKLKKRRLYLESEMSWIDKQLKD
jgi:hypothetical protein